MSQAGESVGGCLFMVLMMAIVLGVLFALVQFVKFAWSF